MNDKSNDEKKISPGYHPKKKLDYNNNLDIWITMDKTYSAIYRTWLMELSLRHLTPEKVRVIFTVLSFGGSATLNEISYFTNRQLNSVSVIVNRMTREGLLRKEKSPKRKSKVIVTEKGRELFESIGIDSINMIFSTLSLSEKQEFATDLSTLQEKARNLLGTDYRPPFLPALRHSD